MKLYVIILKNAIPNIKETLIDLLIVMNKFLTNQKKQKKEINVKLCIVNYNSMNVQMMVKIQKLVSIMQLFHLKKQLKNFFMISIQPEYSILYDFISLQISIYFISFFPQICLLYIIIILEKQESKRQEKGMSSQGDFQDFDFDNVKPNQNMEEFMDKVDKFSIDWDNFDAPNDSKQGQHSAVSDTFNKSKKSISEKSQKQNFQDSRDIMQISVIVSQNQNTKSFRFEKQDQRDYPKTNQRYSRLQNLLETAKKNSLEQFYKNIDQQNKAYNEEPQKFNNYPEFREFVKELKKEKKQKQMIVLEREITNPFQTMNSNKMYMTSGSNKFGNGSYNQQQQRNQQQQPQYNFTKKTNGEKAVVIGTSNSLLPSQFAEQHFFEADEQVYQKVNPVAKFNNFYQGGQKLPQKAPQHNRDEDAFQFFQIGPKKSTDKKQKQAKQSLQPIRQQKHNSFQKTFQQQKLNNIFQNYQIMRKNFQQLMGELKSTSQGQQQIITQLRKLKDQKYENQLKQQQRLRRQKRERQNQEKYQKLQSIKDQINKIKATDKDILLSQINKKIQQLESVVRSALEEINQEKQAKIVPKVTNYFCEHENRFQNIDKEFENGFDNQKENRHERHEQDESRSHNQSRELFTQNIGNIQSKKQILQSPSQYSDQKNSRAKLSNKQSKAKIRSPQQSRYSQSGSRGRQNNFYSPLDLHLQNNNYSQQYSQQSINEEFIPQEFAEEHFAREFQGYTKNLRNSLLQKSSVVFESFDFHVSARFSVVDDPIHPIAVAMRVGNKCSIDLYDVHAIIYGPQGPGISTDPSTIFQQEVKKNSSFAFQVSVDKTCLQDNGFNIQISYKTDSMSKKKINFKVPLPLVQLIRPQFVYEQKFLNDWYSLQNELYLRPKRLDSAYLRSHEDLKLILPFIQLSQQDPDSFSYGLMFKYPKSDNVFYMKITCYVSGKAALQLRSQRQGDKKLKEEILNVFNFILFSSV